MANSLRKHRVLDRRKREIRSTTIQRWRTRVQGQQMPNSAAEYVWERHREDGTLCLGYLGDHWGLYTLCGRQRCA